MPINTEKNKEIKDVFTFEVMKLLIITIKIKIIEYMPRKYVLKNKS